MKYRLKLGAGALAVLSVVTIGCGKKGSSDATDVGKTLNAGLQAHAAHHLSEAVTAYQSVLKADKFNKFALYNLGLIAQDSGHSDEAESRYQSALDVDPKYEPAVYNLAVLRSDKGDLAGAITLYRRALTLNANDANSHLNLGLLLKRNNDMAGGDAEIQTALALNPKLRPAPAPVAAPGPMTANAATGAERH
jgi:tetratricopeptide (TPR) repeat protein